MASNGQRFPSSVLIKDSDFYVLKLSGELLHILEELNNRVFACWASNKTDRQLWRASSQLVQSCISLSDPVILLKRVVIKSARPYWLSRSFLDPHERRAILGRGDLMIPELVKRADQLEAEISSMLH